ncbi:MAG TPA: Ig-like domain-containing protein, partial [Archangium sp.]
GHVTTGVRDLANIAMTAQYDFTFRTKDPGPPRVVSTFPANGATISTRFASLDIQLNEPLLASSVNGTTFFCDVPTTLYQGFSDTSITLRATSGSWPNGGVVTCRVTNIRDLDDVPMAAPYDFSFNVPDTVGPQVLTRVPAASATGVSINSTVSARFDEPIDPATVSTTGFNVQGRTGTVSYDSATRTVTWTDSAPFANNTSYTVRVTNSLRDLVGNGAITTNWSFTTEPDTTRPVVTSTLPANNATNVLQTLGRMRANFSEPMNAATVNGGTFTCTRTVGSTTTSEPGTVGYNATQRAAYFLPSTPFVYGARYTCTLSTAVADLVGNTLAAPVVFTFVVEADTYPPRVARSTPAHFGHFVAVNSALTVTFDEDVLATSVNATNLQLSGVSSTVTYDAGTRTATVTPLSTLAGDRGYVLTVNGVRDLGNRPMTTPTLIEFRTTPTTQRVSGVTAPSFGASTAVQMTNGVLHLTRVWNGGNDYRLQWAYLSGSTWTNGDLGVVSSGPDFWTAAYGTNRAGVAWRTNTGRVFASFDGTTWTTPTAIDDEFGTVMSGGNVLGLFSPATGGGVEVQFFDGAAWGPVTQLATQGSPNSLAYNGSEWVAVYRYATGTIGDWYVYARVLSGGTWGAPTTIATFPRPSTSAPKWAVATNPSGFAVAFVDRGEGYCAVRANGVWQTRVTNGFTGGRNDWFELASNGTGYAWVYTVGAGVWDLHYRIWDGATQTWSAQPTQGVPFTAYLGRGRSFALASHGGDYFVAQELETSGVKL